MTLCSLTTQTPFDMLLSIWLYAIYTVHHSKGCDLIGLFKTRCFSPKRSDVFILNCNVSWHTVWLLTKLRGEFEFRVVKAFYMQSLILVNTIVKFSGDNCCFGICGDGEPVGNHSEKKLLNRIMHLCISLMLSLSSCSTPAGSRIHGAAITHQWLQASAGGHGASHLQGCCWTGGEEPRSIIKCCM